MRKPHVQVAIVTAFVVAAEVVFAIAFNDRQWVAPLLLFWGVVVAASLCFVTAVALMVVAQRNQQPELGFVGLFFSAVSLLPLVHGITTPGVLYGDNTATAASVFWAIPVGMAALSPSLLRSTGLGRAISRRWREWSAGWIVLMIALGVTMLVWPNLVPVPAMGSRVAVVAVAASLGATIFSAWRHVRLARIAENNGPLVIAFGYVLVGTSALVFISAPPYAPHFWLAHVLDIGGVFLATVGGVVVYLRKGDARTILAPVVALDPHAALEVGLSPVVHEFVADLEGKDQVTRDHVVRCGSLAIDLATKLGLSPDEVRAAGLVGLLHDVGKLEIPDSILNKPGQLSDAEFDVIKTHTTVGFELLNGSVGLEILAPLVRGHHERIDGRGYPDALRADQIPFISRLVAVCDAFDAITMTRQYREGRSLDSAHAILREHAGAQWDEVVVAAMIALTSDENGRDLALAPPLDHVGRDDHQRIGCGCLPSLVTADS